jgi:hypothetical protein
LVPVERVPADAAQRLHPAVAVGWQERVAGIAASEAAADARATTVDVPMPAGIAQPPVSSTPRPPSAPARPRRARWLVPSLAAAVLAALAGTSIWLGGQPASSPSGVAGSGSASKDASRPAPMAAPDVAAPASAPATGESGGGGAAPPQDSVGGATGNAKSAVEAVPPPDGIDEFVAPSVCVPVFSATAPLVLPDGRIPQQVLVGPYGIRLVCG